MMIKMLLSPCKWLMTVLMVGSVMLCGCAAHQTPQAVSPDESLLRVGISPDSPPLISKKGDTPIGLEADLARDLGAFLGKQVRFIEVPWDEQITALLDDRTDIIMSGMSITPLREVRIAFSEPYFRTGQMALIGIKNKRIAPYGFYGIMGISLTLRFGVVKGTTGENFVNKNFSKAKEIEPFKTAQAATAALLRGRIDILIYDAPMILMLAAENESKGLTVIPSLLTEEYLAWGLRKSDPDLIEAVNRFVDHIAANGQLDELIRRWIPFAK